MWGPEERGQPRLCKVLCYQGADRGLGWLVLDMQRLVRMSFQGKSPVVESQKYFTVRARITHHQASPWIVPLSRWITTVCHCHKLRVAAASIDLSMQSERLLFQFAPLQTCLHFAAATLQLQNGGQFCSSKINYYYYFSEKTARLSFCSDILAATKRLAKAVMPRFAFSDLCTSCYRFRYKNESRFGHCKVDLFTAKFAPFASCKMGCRLKMATENLRRSVGAVAVQYHRQC